MSAAPGSKDEQVELWNGGVGRNWVEAQALLDGMFKPFEDLLADAASTGAPSLVLDIGCGTGAVSLAVARRLGAQGAVTGVDISAPMLALARERAAQAQARATFVQADAETHAFAPATFDAFVSRFGVMFFSDPVRAFTTLRGAGKPGASLTFAAWRSAADNPFMTTAERAAAPFLPAMPPRLPDAPGQFAFADAEKVRGILALSCWRDTVIEPIDIPCALPAQTMEDFATRLGPLGRVLPEVDDAATRRLVLTAVRNAFQPFVHGDTVRYVAACWLVRARA